MAERFDILISGAGIAGMVAAAALSRRGSSVCLCDPGLPPEALDAEGSDLRTTAYLEPSRQILEDAGVWGDLQPHATPLRALRVIDTHGAPPRETDRRTFEAAQVGLSTFGWNVPNWRARKVLSSVLAETARVDLRLGTGFAGMVTRDAQALVRLTDGARIEARLVLGADGRASPVREAAGIPVRILRYGQKAFALAVTHDAPHEDVSLEIYARGGAFTTVPLHDHDARPASAIVWMNEGPRAADLLRMDRAGFDRELTLRSLALLGRMRRVTPIRTWPVVTQTARAVVSRRVALIAEAAHVLPPIGAQGLNTSLADIAALISVMGDDPGDEGALARYAARRGRDIAARSAVIDVFNRICKSDNPAVSSLRTAGLRAVHDLAPLRRGIMEAGLGGT